MDIYIFTKTDIFPLQMERKQNDWSLSSTLYFIDIPNIQSMKKRHTNHKEINTHIFLCRQHDYHLYKKSQKSLKELLEGILSTISSATRSK